MKRSLLILGALCLPLQDIAQGHISFNNYGSDGSPFAPVYGPDQTNPGMQKWGNAADALHRVRRLMPVHLWRERTTAWKGGIR